MNNNSASGKESEQAMQDSIKAKDDELALMKTVL